MEIGIYETIVMDENISQICRKIAGAGEETDVFQICERYGTKPDEFRAYDTYKIYDSGETKIIKRVELREYNNYLRYLKGKDLNVPKLLGSDTEGKDFWIMLENVEGQDLRDMTDELACAAADSISTIQNQYWGSEDVDRFEEYLERIHRRYECIKDNPQIAPAYKLFMERQETCPRTLANGDFLQFNAIEQNGTVYIIDWGFGGIMPYSLDLARFIAHATEDRATFPFFMKEQQKELFLNKVYEKLDHKPGYQQYRRDIQLALLNEYVEFVEADEDEDGWYLQHAIDLANLISSQKIM